MATPTKSYNPGFLTDDQLKAMFCVRLPEFESLIETLRENTGESNQHALVIGPRGSGKTTLLLRVALEARSDPELRKRLYPIVFAEESYSVGTCGEFWLECLSRLAQQEQRGAGEVDLRRTVEDLRAERDDVALRERCLGVLLDFAEQRSRRLVLLAENLDMLFSDMTDPDAGWCLRKTLQTEPRVMLIGSATSRFGEIDRPDRALYDLFRILTLRPLDKAESAALCERVTGRELEVRVVRRLQILTGGSPRLLAIMTRFGAARSFRGLLSDLLDLVDEHTTYFKSHMESLPAQERRVYLALVELWRPATAREVAGRARIETSKCSAQLRRLMGRGVVLDAGGTDRKREYYVSERLYNIYYLLRRSRGSDGLVEALVRFMDAFYTSSELKKMTGEMVGELPDLDPIKREVQLAALRRLSILPKLARHFHSAHPDLVPCDVRAATKEASVLLNRSSARFTAGDLRGALAILDELVRSIRGHPAPTVREIFVKALVNRGNVLERLERPEAAMRDLDEVEQVPDGRESSDLRPVLAAAGLLKSYLLQKLARTQEANDVCDRLIDTFACDSSDPVAEYVAGAMLHRGLLLEEMGRAEDALAAFDELQRRFGSAELVGVVVFVAAGQNNRAAVLDRLGRQSEALHACENTWDTWNRLSDHASTRLLLAACTAMVIKSGILSRSGRSEECLEVCRAVLDALDRHEERAVVQQPADDRTEDVLYSRLKAHEIRATTYITAGNVHAVADDVRAILAILPRVAKALPEFIRFLMIASHTLGVDQMVSLIRQSPSAADLLALTTALEMELGEQPRVATEVQEVARDIRRELARVRQESQDGASIVLQ